MADPQTLHEAAHLPASRFSRLAFLRCRWTSLDRVQWGLLALMGLRWLLDLLFLLDVLPLDLRYGWYLHHGGDQELMLSLARSIVSGSPEESVVGLGQALVMIPWVMLLDPYNYLEIVVPLVVINGFLLGGLSVLIVGGIARAVTHNGRAALLAAGLWAILPLLTYFAFFWHADSVVLRSANVPKLGWLNGLSDGPATFFLMLAILLLARHPHASETGFWPMVSVGVALSVAVMFRIHSTPMVAFLLAYVLAVHGWRALLVVCGAGLIAYLPQAWYNLSVFGIPFTTGYISYGALQLWGRIANRPLVDLLKSLPFHPRNILESVAYFLGRRPWLVVPLVIGLAAGIGLWMFVHRRRGREVALLLLGAPLAYLVPMVMAYNFRADVIRFVMPAIPAGLVAVVDVMLAAWTRLANRLPMVLRGDRADVDGTTE